MNQDLQRGPEARGQMFQQIDADAVCEQCGTVNDEGTLLCKVCGQNLRDQRARRLAAAQGPEVFEERISRVRVFTGLVSVLGLLVIVYAVLNIANIEASLVALLTEAAAVEEADIWSGSEGAIFDELQRDLEEYPTSRARMEEALANPIQDRSYNGRYVLLRPGRLDVGRVLGEASLSRRGDRVYFVANIPGYAMRIRGYALLEEIEESSELRVVVRNTAGVQIDGERYGGFGIGERLEDGGHRLIAASDYDESLTNQEILAYRVR